MRNFKKFLALALATMMVLSGVVTVSAAEEVTAAPEETVVAYDYTAAAEELATLGIVKGTSDDVIDFTLEENVLRYQMTLLFARITTGECDDTYWKGVANNTPFNDIDNWFGAIEHCYENGIIMGKEITTFGPYDAITYEQALTMAVRALGYKQLDYYEGFVNFAKKLGLTDGLEELAIGTQLTRGQMFQIAYNTLFAIGADGKSFAAKNFGIVDEVFVVAATERQHLAGAGSKTGISGLVRLAKLNADGTYDFNNTILVTTEFLGLDVATDVEAKLAYSYTVTYADNAGYYKAAANDTYKFVNYGDTQKDIAEANVLAFQAATSITAGGVNYKLVESYSKNAVVNELIVHSLYKADTQDVTAVDFDYDVAGNILYPANFADATLAGKIGLLYNATLGQYMFVKTYKADGTPATTRPATEDDLKLFVVTVATAGTQTYGLVANKSEIFAHEFFEITMIDDNNDGIYDRGVYIPYSVAQLGNTAALNSTVYNSVNPITGATVRSGGSSMFIGQFGSGSNWRSVRGYIEVEEGGKLVTKGVTIPEDFFLFSGVNFVPADFYVYWYNPYSCEFHLVENIGKSGTAGVVTGFTFGTYNSTTGTWDGATVTIGDTTYGQGFRLGAFYNQKFLDNSPGSAVASTAAFSAYYGKATVERTYFDNEWDLANASARGLNSAGTQPATTLKTSNGALTDGALKAQQLVDNGFAEVVLNAAALGAVRPVKYIAVGGRVVRIADAGTTAKWIAFDYGKFETIDLDDLFDVTNIFNQEYFNYEVYEGDIVGIDENGYLEVNAYTDGTGVKQVVKVATINGVSYADYLKTLGAYEDYAAGLGVFGYQYQQLIRKYAIDILKANYAAGQQYVFVISQTYADGSIDLYTKSALYGGSYDSLIQPSTTAVTTGRTLTFTNGISNLPYKDYTTNNSSTTDANETNIAKNNIIKTSDFTTITVIGTDGIKVKTGMFKDGETLKLNAGDHVYAIGSSQIVIASKAYTCAQIYSGFVGVDYTDAKYYIAVTGTDAYYISDGRFSSRTLNSADNTTTKKSGKTYVQYAYNYLTATYEPTYTYTLWDIATSEFVTYVTDELLPGFTFKTASDIDKRGGAKVGLESVDDGCVYVVIDGELKEVIAEENAASYIATTVYPKVYNKLGFVEGASAIINTLDLVNGDIINKNVDFKNIYFVQFNYTENAITVTVGNTASYERAKFGNNVEAGNVDFIGTHLFYNYEGNTFAGAFVAVVDADNAQKTAAKATVAAAAAGYDLAALVAEANAAIDAARVNSVLPAALTAYMADTYAEVAAAYVAKINAAIATINAGLVGYKAEKVAALEAAAGTTYAADAAVVAAVAAGTTAINACDTVAAVDAAFATAKTNVETAVANAAKAAADAQLAADKTAAKAVIDAAAASYTHYSAVADLVTAGKAAVDAAADKAAADAAAAEAKAAIEAKVAEILAAEDAAAAEAAKIKAFVTASQNGKVIEVFLQNVAGIDSMTFHELQDNGVLFADVVAVLPVDDQAIVANKAGETIGTFTGVIDGNNSVYEITAAGINADNYGNFIPVLEVGGTYGVTIVPVTGETIKVIFTVEAE